MSRKVGRPRVRGFSEPVRIADTSMDIRLRSSDVPTRPPSYRYLQNAMAERGLQLVSLRGRAGSMRPRGPMGEALRERMLARPWRVVMPGGATGDYVDLESVATAFGIGVMMHHRTRDDALLAAAAQPISISDLSAAVGLGRESGGSSPIRNRVYVLVRAGALRLVNPGERRALYQTCGPAPAPIPYMVPDPESGQTTRWADRPLARRRGSPPIEATARRIRLARLENDPEAQHAAV